MFKRWCERGNRLFAHDESYAVARAQSNTRQFLRDYNLFTANCIRTRM